VVVSSPDSSDQAWWDARKALMSAAVASAMSRG
jgi:hypothetical protein